MMFLYCVCICVGVCVCGDEIEMVGKRRENMGSR